MRILLTGATGFIGRRLASRLNREGGHELVVLTRGVARARGILPSPYEAYAWEPHEGLPPEKALEGVEAVVHLLGENVGAHRWTSAVKREIFDSRVLSTKNLMMGLTKVRDGLPLTIVSASAIGFYGDRGDEWLTEESPAGRGFLSEVCQAWEGEVRSRCPKDARVFIPRFGAVFGKDGGALEKIVPVFRKGLGGTIGTGHQWMSWIHLDDAVGLILQALRDERYTGILNAVAPEPVRNRDFAEELAGALGTRPRLPVPAMAARLAMGEMASLALDSQRVSARKLAGLGFSYRYPQLREALELSV